MPYYRASEQPTESIKSTYQRGNIQLDKRACSEVELILPKLNIAIAEL
jgi:hypothetical protein